MIDDVNQARLRIVYHIMPTNIREAENFKIIELNYIEQVPITLVTWYSEEQC